MYQVLKAMHLKYISMYYGFQTKKSYTKITKYINLRCPMPAILNFKIFFFKCVIYSSAYGRNWFSTKKIIWKRPMKYFSLKIPTDFM